MSTTTLPAFTWPDLADDAARKLLDLARKHTEFLRSQLQAIAKLPPEERTSETRALARDVRAALKRLASDATTAADDRDGAAALAGDRDPVAAAAARASARAARAALAAIDGAGQAVEELQHQPTQPQGLVASVGVDEAMSMRGEHLLELAHRAAGTGRARQQTAGATDHDLTKLSGRQLLDKAHGA